MSDGIRDELRELLFDSAPPPEVDTAAMFERTFAADGPDGSELLPPDGLFDLPADDPADELLLDGLPADAPLEDPGLDDGGPDDAGLDDAGFDAGFDDAGTGDEVAADEGTDDGSDGIDPGAPFGDHGTGAGW
jgi:hypothetical protein